MAEQGGTAVNGTGPMRPAKSRRQLAWERLMLRLLSLEPGMYTISLAIDDKEGYLVGSIECKGKVERWG
jgi:hypothetical protein